MADASAQSLLSGTKVQWEDIVVIVLYFVVVLAVGLIASCWNRGSVGGYFLAGRNMNFLLVGASLFASNIGSGHFVGLAGSAASSGIGIAVFELNAIFILMLLGWVFVPVYIASGIFTMPEFLRKRFGGQRIRVYLSILALLLYIFTKISADLYAGAVFIEQALGLNLYIAVVILLFISALFTITGGLTAVIWTDFIQTIIMIVGAFSLMILSFNEVGGYDNVVTNFFYAWPNTSKIAFRSNYSYSTCGIPPANSMSLIRSPDDGSLPWPGVMFGLSISSVWYWCSDQVIVQRVLAAKNLSHAKLGTVVAGYLKVLPMFLLVFPGMIARIIFPDEVGCGDPEICKAICHKEGGCSDIAYPLLVLKLMPSGARGLMLACMMSALMSSLTSIFNSSSTIFTMDIWIRFRKNASEAELMIVGRVFVILLVGIGIAWLPVVQSGSELFHYIQAITSFLAPPVCAVYVLAVLWTRTNEMGAFWGLMIGFVVGMIRFIWEFSYGQTGPGCSGAVDPKPAILRMHYLHFGIILFCVVFVSTIAISFMTEPIPERYLYRLTFWSRHDTRERADIPEKGGEFSEFPCCRKEQSSQPPSQPNSQYGSKDVLAAEDGKTGNEPEEALPLYKRIGYWICGIEKLHKQDAPLVLEEANTSIDEAKMWRIFTNINAVVLMTIATFVWGFYN